MSKRIRLRKRDVKRIAKAITKRMDALEFNMTLRRDGGADDCESAPPEVKYFKQEAVDESDNPRSVVDDIVDSTLDGKQSFSDGVAHGRDIAGESSVSVDKGPGGAYVKVTGNIVEQIADLVNPTNLDNYAMSKTFILRKRDDGVATLELPLCPSKLAQADGRE